MTALLQIYIIQVLMVKVRMLGLSYRQGRPIWFHILDVYKALCCFIMKQKSVFNELYLARKSFVLSAN